ncbi:SdpI family protein [Flavobacterium sp. C4GT6]|uniref:SdpI family protein n=1 Tax=Flavobacterium sp. C4GT6 TaxID=3103818 RepID=UPI002ED432E9
MNTNWDFNIISVTGLMGLIFVIAAIIMYCYPPKKINHLYGYRTSASMASQQRWDFSQKYSTRIMLWGGLLFTVTGLLFILLKIPMLTDTCIGLLGAVIFTAFIFIKTERELKKRFGKN